MAGETTMIHAQRTSLAALAIVAAAALLSACDKKTTVTDVPAGSNSTTSSSTSVSASPAASNAMAATASAMNNAGDAVGDAAVTGKVKSALIADPDVKALQIDVDTKNGVVTLTGSADKSANVDRAVTVAKGVEGVKSVDSKLTVKP
jgi:hyperosmotically inducible protein